jgi:hypothetical protein
LVGHKSQITTDTMNTGSKKAAVKADASNAVDVIIMQRHTYNAKTRRWSKWENIL